MPNIVPPNPTQPIVDESGSMTQVYRGWASLITQLDLIIGTGSPEGVVDSKQGRLYMDDAGATGAVLYIKRDLSVAGDSTQGWILV